MEEYEKIKAKLNGKMNELLLPEDDGIFEVFNSGMKTMFYSACSIILDFLTEKRKADEKSE